MQCQKNYNKKKIANSSLRSKMKFNCNKIFMRFVKMVTVLYKLMMRAYNCKIIIIIIFK